MGIKSFITDGNGTGCTADVSAIVNGTRSEKGLIVQTDPYRLYDTVFIPFLNDTFGNAMNQNAGFTGTPVLIHDGTDTGAWTGVNIVGSKVILTVDCSSVDEMINKIPDEDQVEIYFIWVKNLRLTEIIARLNRNPDMCANMLLRRGAGINVFYQGIWIKKIESIPEFVRENNTKQFDISSVVRVVGVEAGAIVEGTISGLVVTGSIVTN